MSKAKSADSIGRYIAEELARAGILSLSPGSPQVLTEYLGEVEVWSARMHLVGRGKLQRSLRLQLLDSLLLLRVAEDAGLIEPLEAAAPQSAPVDGESSRAPRSATKTAEPVSIADIGSGAGFPGLVWKIVRRDFDVTLFERKERPRAFLERIVRHLALDGVRVAGEAEGAGSFGIVTSKAAGRLAILLPLAEALLVPGGAYLTVKGRGWRSELEGISAGRLRLEAAAELPQGRGDALIFKKM